MCNLYSITNAREAVRRLFNVGDNRTAACDPLPVVFPGHTAPVVHRAVDGESQPLRLSMSWGFVLPQSSKAAKRVTNAPGDTLRTSQPVLVQFVRATPLPGAGYVI